MENIFDIEKVKDKDGNEYSIAFSVELNEKEVAVCANRKVFVKDENGIYKECEENNEIMEIMEKYLKQPESLDVEYDDIER